MADENEGKTKRAQKIATNFVFSDGTNGKRLATGKTPTALELTVLATGEKLTVEWDKVPEATRLNGAFFGIKTSLTNTMGAKDSSFSDMQDRYDLIMAGEWAEAAGEGGPSPTMLAEAYFRAFTAAGKTTFSDGSPFTHEGCIERIKAADAEKRKTIKADPLVAAAFAELQLEAAKKRAAELKKAAKGAESALDL